MSASNQTRKHHAALLNPSPERSDQQTTQDEEQKHLPLTVAVGEGKSPLQTQTEAVSSALLSSTPLASHHPHHHQQHHHLPAVYHCEEGIIQLVDTGCNNEDTLSSGEGAGPAAARSDGAAAATSDSGSSQGSTFKHGSAMMANRAAPPLSPSGGGIHAPAPTSLLRHAHRVSSNNLVSSADATPAISINDEKRIVFPTSTRHPANPRPHTTTNTTSSPHINSVGIFPSPVSLGIHPHPRGGGSGGGHFAAVPKHKASNSQTGSMAASLTAISSSCVGMSSNCVGVTGLAIPQEGITSGFPSPPLGGSCTTPTAGLRNVPHLMRCSSSTPFDISTTSTTSANCCHPPLGFVVGESPSLFDDSTGSRSMASSLTYNVSAASFTGVVTPLPIAAAASAIPQANKANSAAKLLLPPPTTMAVGATQEDFTNPLNSIATERKKTDHEAAEAPQLSSTLPPFVAATAVRADSTEDFPIEFPCGDSRRGSMSGNSSTLSLGIHDDNTAFAQKTSLTQQSTQRRENTLPPVSPSISPRASSVGPNFTPKKKSSDGNIKSCDKKASSGGKRTSVSTSSAAVNSSFSIDAASANDEVAVHNINFNAVQQCFFGYTGPQHQIGGGSVAAPLTPAAATTISSLTEHHVDAQEQDAETETNVLTAAAAAGSIDDDFISPIPFAIEDRDRPPGFKMSPQKKQKERNNKAQTSDDVISTAAPSISSVLELNNSAMNEGNHRRQPAKSVERSSQLTAVGDAHQRCSSECCESSDSVMQNEDLNTALSDTAAKNNSSSNSNSGDVIKKEDEEQSGSTAEVLSPLPARQHHTDPTALARPRKK